LAAITNRITIKDIAGIARVSPGTVSLVLNDRLGVNSDTRYRILRTARELNHLPNLVARSQVTRQSAAIAMIITSTRNPIFPSRFQAKGKASGTPSVACLLKGVDRKGDYPLIVRFSPGGT
jgi:hypothetical protein